MLASPATESPETTETASGRNRPSSMVRAARATKRPFPVIERKKSGASWPGCDSVLLTETEIRTGTAARTSSPAWLRRRPNISRSSERKNRGDQAALGDRTTVVGDASATDIEALPGERDEQVLERLPADPEAQHRDARVHAGGDDLLRGHLAEVPGGGARGRVDLGQAELGHHPGGVRGSVGLDGRLGVAAGPQLGARALGDE